MRHYFRRLDRLAVSGPQDSTTLVATVFICPDSKEAVSALLRPAGVGEDVWLERSPLEAESAFLARVDNAKADLEARRPLN